MIVHPPVYNSDCTVFWRMNNVILTPEFFHFQYIHPSDAHKLGQAELVVIDEAAAIPLPLVKDLMGPYLVFLSSTVNG